MDSLHQKSRKPLPIPQIYRFIGPNESGGVKAAALAAVSAIDFRRDSKFLIVFVPISFKGKSPVRPPMKLKQ
jgi:hypothetical protein